MVMNMRYATLLFPALLVIGGFWFGDMGAIAQTKPNVITLERGETKTVSKGKLSIRFVEVVEDSRCPVNTQCIWAGNAKVKIKVAKGRAAFVAHELNSNGEPNVIKTGGYEIRFSDLKSGPGEEPSDAIVKPKLSLEVKRVK
jgi:hypothetical protein